MAKEQESGAQQEAKYRQMIETPIPRLVATLAVPTIISMLVTSIYNMADTLSARSAPRRPARSGWSTR